MICYTAMDNYNKSATQATSTVALFPDRAVSNHLLPLLVESLVEISMYPTLVLVSRYYSPQKSWAPWKSNCFQVWGRTSTKYAWDIFCTKQTRKCSKSNGITLKGHRSQLEGLQLAKAGTIRASKGMIMTVTCNVCMSHIPLLCVSVYTHIYHI